MNRQLIVFYLKRHMGGIIGLVLAIGFGVGGFMMMGKAKGALTDVETDFKAIGDKRANIEKGQALGGSQAVKVISKNVDLANDEAEAHKKFIKDAARVIRLDSIDPMTSEQFMVHMANVIKEMNLRAHEALVQVQPDPTNTSVQILYNFTFMNLRAVPQLSKDKIPELQKQLKDIRAISDILFQSRVRSIDSLQRTRVTLEDFKAGASKDFLDTRLRYTNNISVVRPYKVRFKCLSGGIAKTLNGFASQKSFLVIRKMEVTQLGDRAPAAGDFGGGLGMGGFPGAEGSPGAGSGAVAAIAKPKKVLTPQMVGWLVRQGLATAKATNVISESVLEVELDLDVIRKLPDEPVITTQPVTQSVTAGNDVNFSVVATGSGTLSYQWRKGEEDIPEETSASYTISNAQSSHAGSYSVVVSNSAGNATSNAAVLTVPPPTIAPQPEQPPASTNAPAASTNAIPVNPTTDAPSAP